MPSSDKKQLSLRSQQRVVATVEESVLRMEMAGLESQEEDDPSRVLFFKPNELVETNEDSPQGRILVC